MGSRGSRGVKHFAVVNYVSDGLASSITSVGRRGGDETCLSLSPTARRSRFFFAESRKTRPLVCLSLRWGKAGRATSTTSLPILPSLLTLGLVEDHPVRPELACGGEDAPTTGPTGDGTRYILLGAPSPAV